jgi:hypothetical protein
MEAIDVTAEFDSQGRVTPLSFKWRSRSYHVTSTGRRWRAEDGYHVLIMTAGDKVFHLCFVSGEDCWYLILTSNLVTNSVV